MKPSGAAVMFEWSSNLSVGVTSIDAQHQTLFAMARELRDAVELGTGNLIVGRLLDRLASYTYTHFAHEERMMQLHSYPGLEKHREEHNRLRLQVEEYRLSLRQGHSCINLQVLLFLKRWLVDHIGRMDIDAAGYFHAGGADDVLLQL
jgi:hemerythrin-like metal-binding protein